MSRNHRPNPSDDAHARPPEDLRSSPSPFPLDPAALNWDDAVSTLVALAADDLLREYDPIPTIVAFSGDEPVAIVGLRPFETGDVGQALVEVLSLLVPLGADRLAFGGTGRIWSLDDPIVPVCEEGDLRQRAIVIALADAHDGPCRLATSVHPFEGTGADLVLQPPIEVDGEGLGDAMELGPAAAILVGALEQRTELFELTQPRELVAQLGRVLLLGHDLALAPDPAASLTAASSV